MINKFNKLNLGLNEKLHWQHLLILIALTIISIPITSLVFVCSNWIFYSIITERDGLNGHYYQYYEGISKAQYLIYLSFLSISSLFFIFSQLIYSLRKKIKSLIINFSIFLIWLLILYFSELYLASKWVGKG